MRNSSVCARSRARGTSSARYRCDGSGPGRRGNCRLPGPPGALRHHKAYATGIVLVLKPASNTTLRLAARPPSAAALFRRVPFVPLVPSGVGRWAAPRSACMRRPDHFLETAAGPHPLPPRAEAAATATSRRLFNNRYLWEKLARRSPRDDDAVVAPKSTSREPRRVAVAVRAITFNSRVFDSPANGPRRGRLKFHRAPGIFRS